MAAVVRTEPSSAEQDQPRLSRSTILAYRLRYAAKGIRTSPADTKRKKPVLKGWQKLATADPRWIHNEYNNRALPDYDGILTPTGSQYGRWVFDVDSLEDLERLERKLGASLRQISTEVRTQSGHRQFHFCWPKSLDIPCSTGKSAGDGFEGLDVKGEGGLVLLPPSAGYSFANDLPMAQAPPELVEWAIGRKRAAPVPDEVRSGSGVARTRQNPTVIRGDGRIPKGTRHETLASILGRKHDGSRTLDQLTELALQINATSCDPPIGSPGDDDDLSDVVRIARSIFAKPPFKPARNADPKVEELLEEVSAYWYSEYLPKGGKSKLRDTFRACLISAAKRRELRTVDVDGEEVRGLAFSESTRQLAEVVNTSHVSVWKHLRTLEEMGALVEVESPEGLAPTFVLLARARDAREVNTPNNASPLPEEREVGGGVNPVRADVLKTVMYGWRSPVGISGGSVEVALEAFGPQTTEALARRLGIARLRDLERRQLRRLVRMGVIVGSGGVWSLPADHQQRVERRLHEPYVTVQRRRERRRTNDWPRGRWVVEVVETVTEASEAERIQARREKHVREREHFAEQRRKAMQDSAEADEQCRELLNAWDEEREAAGEPVAAVDTVSRTEVQKADGEISELKRDEIEPPDAPVRGSRQALCLDRVQDADRRGSRGALAGVR